MVSITILLYIIWAHFIADFILQTEKMANNKSSSNKWLLSHVSMYWLLFLPLGLTYAAVNFILHFITDWLSSRATTYLWKQGKVRRFFQVIGLDQALHMTALVLTAPLINLEWLSSFVNFGGI